MRACQIVVPCQSLLLGGLLLALYGAAGCGSSKKLDTAAVRGKVVFEKGGTVQKLHDVEATVLFEAVGLPELRGSAAIAKDGSLTNIVTRKKDAVEYGLAEGTYRVRLEVAEGHQVLVHPRFLSFEKSGITVKVPGDGDIVIKVWR